MPTCRSQNDFPRQKFIFVHLTKTAGTVIMPVNVRPVFLKSSRLLPRTSTPIVRRGSMIRAKPTPTALCKGFRRRFVVCASLHRLA